MYTACSFLNLLLLILPGNDISMSQLYCNLDINRKCLTDLLLKSQCLMSDFVCFLYPFFMLFTWEAIFPGVALKGYVVFRDPLVILAPCFWNIH